jgi:predicted metal-dependent hydrolase
MAAGQGAAKLQAGETINLFGIPHSLRPDGRRPRLVAGAIVGCGQDTVDPQLVIRAVRREALRVFEERAAAHCERLGVPTAAVSVTDARTRWGSCTPGGPTASIRLSWRLALAPRDVSEYVVAHECAHIIEANHGPRFWGLVRALVGDPSSQRAFLRIHGAKLHGFGRGRGRPNAL